MVERLTVATTRRQELVDLTPRVRAAVAAAHVVEGLCTVFVPHTTCGLTINENADPAVSADLLRTFARLVPPDAAYAHEEGNSDAHALASMVGHSLAIPVEGGTLALGTWQAVYLAEFDGPRTRSVLISVLAR